MPETIQCNSCSRPGRVVVREMMPAMPKLGVYEPWEFVYALCRWHKAAETRKRRRIFGGKEGGDDGGA